MSSPSHNWILLLDSNAPWVRSLFSALPGVREGRRRVVSWRVHTFGCQLACLKKRTRLSAPLHSGLIESNVLVPGWTRFERASTFLISRLVHRTIRHHGSPEAIVYTLPQYAGVAERFRACPQVYYAFDPYRFYTRWDPLRIGALEKRMLEATNAAFAISRLLVSDLQKRTPNPVFYSPNAVSSDFVKELANGSLSVPADLHGIGGQIVGCVGQLDQVAYDWDLVEALSGAFPQVTFVFIGAFAPGQGRAGTRAKTILAQPNIRWLGPKPHSELPAYLRHFDVCLNPLAVNEHSHRRSLLRLYDYLATDKPILSTAVQEAGEHEGHVQIGRNPAHLSSLLAAMLRQPVPPELPARHRYITNNTWECRASAFYNNLSMIRPAIGTPDHRTRFQRENLAIH